MDNNTITYDIFVSGGRLSPAAEALARELEHENPDMTYSQMMRLRIAGKAASECTDVYFIAAEGGRYAARLWYGWGTHGDPIGNFGNVKTHERYQHRGICSKLLELWHEDIMHRTTLPLGLFCTASKPFLVKMYGKYGFRPALPGRETGPLYCPLGNSPASFAEFCDLYYHPAEYLLWRPAMIGWRHEIDCLLNFHLQSEGLVHGLPGAESLEFAILNPQSGKAELAFTDKGHCVGWAYTPAGGSRNFRLCSRYGKTPFKAME